MSKLTATPMSKQIPAHLRPFAVEQDYAQYTPIDQAVWRYVLRQNSAFLAQKGHGSYARGLQATGMSVERIPRLAEMNEHLARIGWSAVAVDGFIPPVAFFDFQAHGILPIAGDIRTLEHIAYTPAPDIIHESAGHAPMLSDPEYGKFLVKFGEIGAKALSSREDLEVYEAIRLLSIVKEDPEATAEQVQAAEERLAAAYAAVTYASEATLVARLYWWTVEYGLIGTLDNPRIYGAGLLSSMGESRSCLLPSVQKLPFDLDACLQTDYDITKPQPQLFVCRDFAELTAAIESFADRMAFRVGGTESLQKALDSGQLATAVYSSGLQVSGTFSALEYDETGEAVYLKTTGPTALAIRGRELPGQGKARHAEGFGSPIGKLKGHALPLEEFSNSMLREAGLVPGQQTELEFASGVHVQGTVRRVLREAGQIVLITFDECTVTYGQKVLFQAQWGSYDLAVGQKIVSVFAGAADRETFHEELQVSSTTTKKRVLSEKEQRLNNLYQTVRELRETTPSAQHTAAVIENVMFHLNLDFPQDWLLRLELLEILVQRCLRTSLQEDLAYQLAAIAEADPEIGDLIENGLRLLG